MNNNLQSFKVHALSLTGISSQIVMEYSIIQKRKTYQFDFILITLQYRGTQ